jgi:hypothetical protein
MKILLAEYEKNENDEKNKLRFILFLKDSKFDV